MLDSLFKLLKLSSGRHRPVTLSCCFHFGRCGSTLLGNMLNGHPQVDWLSEIFHEFHERTEANKDPREPIGLLRQSIDNCNKPVFGFETKFQHLDSNGLALPFDEFVELLRRSGFSKFIVLRRKNYLRQAISVARGQASKVWHIKTGSESPQKTRVHLDLAKIGLGGKNREVIECFELLDQVYENAIAVFQSNKYDFLELTYEDDLEGDPLIGYQKMLPLLGVRTAETKVSLQKIGGQPIEEMVSNFEEIQKKLSGTPYHWMVSS